MTFKSISLFSGGMGLDIGLEQAGISVSVCQDIDRACISTIEANGMKIIPGDLRRILQSDPRGESFLKLGQIKKKELTLISGGPPCQSFSTVGKRLSALDPRGDLVFSFVHAVESLRPRFFLMENVKGMASSLNNPQKLSGSAILDDLLKAFKKSGYKVICSVVDTVNYGAPQHRERLLIIGSLHHEAIFLPEPTHFRQHQNPDFRWKTLEDAIKKYENEKSEGAAFSTKRKALMSLIPEGGNWRDLPFKLQKEAMGKAFEASGGRSAFYRRLSYDLPSPTLTTNPTHRGTTLCHPKTTRPLSIKEYMAIQGFPENWKILGKTSEKYMQLGNAVPIQLGLELGNMFISVIKGNYITNSRKREISQKYLKEIADRAA